MGKIEFFNQHRVDLAVELHLNAGGGDYSTAIYWDHEDGRSSGGGSRLASALCTQLRTAFPWRSIGAQPQSYFRRLLRLWAPSLLVLFAAGSLYTLAAAIAARRRPFAPGRNSERRFPERAVWAGIVLPGALVLIFGELLLLDEAPKALFDRSEALLHIGLLNVHQHGVDTVRSEGLGNTVAHGASTNDSNGVGKRVGHRLG